MDPEMKRDIEKRLKERKERFTKAIMGELEHYLEQPSYEWFPEYHEIALFDILANVETAVKAVLASNDPTYKG